MDDQRAEKQAAEERLEWQFITKKGGRLQLPVHRFKDSLLVFPLVASRPTQSERETAATCQDSLFAGAIMGRGAAGLRLHLSWLLLKTCQCVCQQGHLFAPSVFNKELRVRRRTRATGAQREAELSFPIKTMWGSKVNYKLSIFLSKITVISF